MLNKKLLLFVVNAHEFTAAHRLPLLNAAVREGYKVEAVAPRGSPALKRLSEEGYVVHPMSLSRRGLRIWEEWYSIRELVRLYRRLQPDLIHHATIKPVLYGSLAAKRAGYPAIVNTITGLGHVYTDLTWRSRLLRVGVNKLYQVALRYEVQCVVFQNHDDWKVLEEIGALDSKQAVLIPGSGVDITYFTPTVESDEESLVVLPARLIREKGVEEFVSAARLLRQRGVHARFVLVGGLDPGNPSAVQEDEIWAWVNEGAVEWWGQCDDMRNVYRASHIVVLPSYREGLPKVLLEAGASARPVVTTDAPGCRDAVVDGQTGYIIPVRNSKALAVRIDQLLQDAELRQSMGRRARAHVEREFSTDRVVADTLAVYDSLLAQRRRC